MTQHPIFSLQFIKFDPYTCLISEEGTISNSVQLKQIFLMLIAWELEFSAQELKLPDSIAYFQSLSL